MGYISDGECKQLTKTHSNKHHNEKSLTAQVVIDERVDELVNEIVVSEWPREYLANHRSASHENEKPT